MTELTAPEIVASSEPCDDRDRNSTSSSMLMRVAMAFKHDAARARRDRIGVVVTAIVDQTSDASAAPYRSPKRFAAGRSPRQDTLVAIAREPQKKAFGHRRVARRQLVDCRSQPRRLLDHQLFVRPRCVVAARSGSASCSYQIPGENRPWCDR